MIWAVCWLDALLRVGGTRSGCACNNEAAERRPDHAHVGARLRSDVLHGEGPLWPGRQQHAALLRPRPVQVSGLPGCRV